MKPSEANTVDKVCKLRRDNFDADGFWIMTDGHEVSIAKQTIGTPAEKIIEIPRATFIKLLAWYTRNQAPSK